MVRYWFKKKKFPQLAQLKKVMHGQANNFFFWTLKSCFIKFHSQRAQWYIQFLFQDQWAKQTENQRTFSAKWVLNLFQVSTSHSNKKCLNIGKQKELRIIIILWLQSRWIQAFSRHIYLWQGWLSDMLAAQLHCTPTNIGCTCRLGMNVQVSPENLAGAS